MRATSGLMEKNGLEYFDSAGVTYSSQLRVRAQQGPAPCYGVTIDDSFIRLQELHMITLSLEYKDSAALSITESHSPTSYFRFFLQHGEIQGKQEENRYFWV